MWELDVTPKAEATKEIINTLDLIKVKYKTHQQESERQSTERTKIFANHVGDKGLVSRLYKDFLQLINEKMGGSVS